MKFLVQFDSYKKHSWNPQLLSLLDKMSSETNKSKVEFGGAMTVYILEMILMTEMSMANEKLASDKLMIS